ncbi:MAG: hypothetical protein AAF570_21975, partial [Bacteroidota bacterium]
MKTSKLTTQIALLSSLELEEFLDFVRSPWHNKNQRVVALLEYYRGKWPELEVDRAEAFGRFYPGESFDAQRFYNVNSLLFRLYESWIYLRECRDAAPERALALMRHYQEQGATKRYAAARRSLETALTNAPDHSEADAAHLRFQATVEDVAFTLRYQHRTPDNALSTASQHLDRFFIISKLRQACEMRNRGHVITANATPGLITEVLTHLNQHLDSYDNPALHLWFGIYQMLHESEGDVHFHATRRLFQAHHHQLNFGEGREICAYLVNFCIRQLNAGHTDYARLLFELYRWAMAHHVLNPPGEMDEWHFKNRISLSIRLQEFEDAHDFIHQNADFLPANNRENAVRYNLATLKFATGAHSEAIRLLQQVRFTDVFYGLDSRLLLMKIYFEAQETEALHALFSAFRLLLHRNKVISQTQKNLYLNFRRFLKKLAKIREKTSFLTHTQSQKLLTHLLEELRTRRQTAQFNWLEGQIEELLIGN